MSSSFNVDDPTLIGMITIRHKARGRRGRPNLTWKEVIQKDMGISISTCQEPLAAIWIRFLRKHAFKVELEKQSYCSLKVANNTEHHVAFKVKTTSPKKYFVRPNTGVIQPWDSCSITVTLQAQSEYPPDMQCKDKFLLQSTIVPPNTDIDDLSPDTFNKDGDRMIDECKLRVVYASLSSLANSEEEQNALRSSKRNIDAKSMQEIQRAQEERDAAIQQARQLQQELEMLRRRRNRGADPGFSLTFAAFVGLIGVMVGFILNLTFSSPSE